MAFYQKFRPQNFADLVGQDHISTTLAGAILSGRISHAYLFTGPRGLGKTSVARILAKAINCQKRSEKEYEPCDKCQNCKEIGEGNSLDVIEIDAASNRGIDEIRDLREKIKFGPSNSKFKVYIIDEVHMLTDPAFNALLKTIEEPPKHAIFILATTELHKVPLTIISRCQKFDFHRASAETVAQKLKKIVKKENLKISPDAVMMIAGLAEGSFRDGESLLDQVAGIAGEEEISTEKVEQILGLSPRENIYKLIEFLTNGDREAILGHIEGDYAQGRDMKQLNYELTEMIRKILLVKTIGYKGDAHQKDLSSKLEVEQIVYLLEKLVEASHEQKITVLPQLPIEMAVINFMSKFKSDMAVKKVIKPEKVVEKPEPKREERIEVKDEADKNQDEIVTEKQKEVKSVEINEEVWKNFLGDLKILNPSLYAILSEAKLLYATDSELRVGVKFKFYVDRIGEKHFKKDFDELTEKFFGKKMRVSAEVSKEEKKSAPKRATEELLSDTLEVFGA